jgi:hypothetical protein
MTFDPTAQWTPRLDVTRLSMTIDRQIKRIGMQAVLRSTDGDRWCWMYFADWTPRELMSRLIEPMDRRALISAIDLPAQPQFGVERLVTFVQPLDRANPVEDETLQIVDPPKRIEPGGMVMVWDCRCRQ